MRPWQSREGTADSHRLSIKAYQPIASVAALTAQPLAALPPYGCGVPFTGGERHWQLQIPAHSADRTGSRNCHCEGALRPWQSREGSYDFAESTLLSGCVPRDCTPRALPRASRSGRHVGLRPPRNDKLESFTPQNVCRKDCQPAWRSLSAATDAIGAYRFNGGRYGLHVQRRARLSAPLHRTAEGLRIIHSSVFIFHMSLLFPCRFTDSRHSAACLPGRRAGFPR